MEQEPGSFSKPEKIKDKSKKDKKKKESRTVETMYRSTLANHMQLSSLADQKAGLLVSVNAIIISIMASFMVRESFDNPYLIIPTCLLVVVCLLTITFALWATRPSVRPQSQKLDAEHIHKMDLLFFADYTALTLEEYQKAMKDMMAKEEKLHDSLLQNIYVQGKVMERKYRLIKIAYTIFIIGFPLVLISYLITLYRA
ncbi:Pycsar system effector family protein [Runella slithyformis]|uniref:Pycsar system effector family protein n=1 Tax=Runella slithyformis TaxID=106 RepID=UPI0002EB9B40|nr:Pycsar system effector family protein [Runella slithyformis]